MRNLITDVPGVKIGQAGDVRLGSGVTVILFDEPAVGSIDVRGGGPGTRETALLDPAQTVEGIDAIALAGGSAFGLDAASGVQAWLKEQNRGFAVRTARVPIVPAAILFDLLNGGDKDWGRFPPYRELGYAATAAAGLDFALGTVGAGTGAMTVNCKGGIGSASAPTAGGQIVGAIAAVNATGSVLIDRGPWFWAAPFERDGEFGGRGLPPSFPPTAFEVRTKGNAREATTLVVVATDAALTKAQGKAARGHGAIRLVARDLSGAHPARRRRGVCGLHRAQAARRPAHRFDRARGGRRQRRGARHRARRVRGGGAPLPRRHAELEGSIRPVRQTFRVSRHREVPRKPQS